MNIEQDHLDAKIRTNIRSNGFSEFRRQALRSLKLKTVIKESHCSQVQHLAFNLCHRGCRNLFATVAKDQATIYDDLHMADHVAVVANLALSNTADGNKDYFHTCCWINSSGLSRHPYGDALLAVAGSEPSIYIISAVEAAVVAQLPLPPGSSAVELSAAAEVPGLLMVLCRDGTLQLWQVATGHCWLNLQTDAFAAVLHPTGDYIVSANRSGKLHKWDLQSVMAAAAAAGDTGSSDTGAAAAAAAAAAGVVKEPLLMPPGQEGSVIDCVRFLSADRLATKTADGRMAVMAMPGCTPLSSWRVPGCSSSTASYSSRCSFGHTLDGQYVCVGNHDTRAYVYDATTGCQVARVEAIRVEGSVRACGMSEDCRHLLMVVGSGYIFRFEYRPSGEGEDDDEDGDEGSSEVEQQEDVDMEAAEQQQQPAAQQQQQQASGSLQEQHHEQQHHQQQQQQQQLLPQEAWASAAATAGLSGHVQAGHAIPQLSPGVMLPGVAGLASGSTQIGLGSNQSPLLPALQAAPGTSGLTPGLTPPTAADVWGESKGPGLGVGWMAGGAAVGGMSPLSEQDGNGTDALQQAAPDGLLAGQQHKRQRLSQGGSGGGGGVSESPLVFRPTPTK